MQLSPLTAAADLAPLVRGYWLLDDRDGSLSRDGLRCGPGVGAVICIQLGDPVETEFETATLPACLTGVQDRVRAYRPQGATLSLLVLFTELGAGRLFPAMGRDIAGTSIDLAGVAGERAVRHLQADAAAAPDGAAMAGVVDAWLRGRRDRAREPHDLRRFAAAAEVLSGPGAGVADAALAADLSVRQLERPGCEAGAPREAAC